MDPQNELQEIFALPIGTYEIGNLDGMKLYSSESLLKKYVLAMRDYKRTKAIGNVLETMVKKQKINPCWLNKGILRLLAHKAVGGTSKMTLGFFYPEVNKIYLLIDNNISFGYASNSGLAQLTLHEGMHMAATTMKQGFAKLFRKELDMYYQSYFRMLFNLPHDYDISKEANAMWTFAYNSFELGKLDDPKAFLKKNAILMKDLFSRFDIPDLDKIIEDYSTLIYIYFRGGLDTLFRDYQKYAYIMNPLYQAYRDVFNTKRLDSFCLQELFYVSEVICISSEYSKDLGKIYSAFKKLS